MDVGAFRGDKENSNRSLSKWKFPQRKVPVLVYWRTGPKVPSSAEERRLLPATKSETGLTCVRWEQPRTLVSGLVGHDFRYCGWLQDKRTIKQRDEEDVYSWCLLPDGC